MKGLTIDKGELFQLNRDYIRSTDKWFRMLMGTASRVAAVKDGVIHLQITYSMESEHSKARQIAKLRMRSSVLNRAHTVVVAEYSSKGRPGYMELVGEAKGSGEEDSKDSTAIGFRGRSD